MSCASREKKIWCRGLCSLDRYKTAYSIRPRHVLSLNKFWNISFSSLFSKNRVLFFTGCPSNTTIVPVNGTQIPSRFSLLNCSSINWFPNVTYKWYNGSTLLFTGQILNTTTVGSYAYRCVPTTSLSGYVCTDEATFSSSSSTAFGWFVICYSKWSISSLVKIHFLPDAMTPNWTISVFITLGEEGHFRPEKCHPSSGSQQARANVSMQATYDWPVIARTHCKRPIT